MTQPADILQYRDLVGQLILDSQTMEEVGRVETLWMYPQRNRVLGVVCRPGRFGAKRLVFKLTQIDAVGEDKLLMQGEPEPTVAAKVQQLESLIGQEVWSDRGERVGKLVDCLFNPDNGVILRYLMTPGTWAAVTDGTYLLSPKQIISFSAKRTLISADEVEALEIYQPGLRQRLAQIRAMLKEEYVDSVTRELRSLSSQVQGMAERAQGQMGSLVQRARERAQTLSQDFSQEAQEVVRTIQTEVQTVTERVEQAIPRGEPTGDPDLEDEDLDDWGDWGDVEEGGARGSDRVEVSEPEVSEPDGLEDWEEEAPRSGPQSSPAEARVVPAGGDGGGDGWDEAAEQVSEPAEGKVDAQPVGDVPPEPLADSKEKDAAIASEALGDGQDLETDERDVWDDWVDEVAENADVVEPVADEPAARDGQESGEGALTDEPSTSSSAEEDEDPWI